VELPALTISAVVLPTSPSAWSRWLRRSLLVLAGSALVKVGLSTSMIDALLAR
jgi:hypothetical protein